MHLMKRSAQKLVLKINVIDFKVSECTYREGGQPPQFHLAPIYNLGM